VPDHSPQALDANSAWRRVLRRFLALAVGEGGARAVSFIAVVVLARRLGPGGFGLVTLGLSIAGWLAIAVDSGTETLSIREIARRPSEFRAIADRMLALRLAMSLAAAAVFAAGVYVFSSSVHDRSVVLRFALILPAVALNLRWMVLGIGGSRAVAVGNIASRLLFTAGVVLLVETGDDVTRVPYLEAAGECVYALIILGLVARRFGWPRPKVDLPYWRTTLRQSLPLMLHGAARATTLAFDVFVVAVILGPSTVGVYGAALKPVVAMLGALGLLLVSFLSSYAATSEEHAAALFRRTLLVGALIAVPATLVLSAGSEVIVPLLFGHGFHESIGLMAVVAWTIPLAAVGVPYAGALIARGHQVQLMRNSVVGVVFTIAATLPAVAVVGVYGAALVRVATSVLVLLLNVRSLNLSRATPNVSLAVDHAG
jgi:O-antigen/teichoic acid export membrane protein